MLRLTLLLAVLIAAGLVFGLIVGRRWALWVVPAVVVAYILVEKSMHPSQILGWVPYGLAVSLAFDTGVALGLSIRRRRGRKTSLISH